MNHYILTSIWFHKRLLTLLGLSFLIATMIIINFYDQEKSTRSVSKNIALPYSYEYNTLKIFKLSFEDKKSKDDLNVTLPKSDAKPIKSSSLLTSPSYSSLLLSPSSSSSSFLPLMPSSATNITTFQSLPIANLKKSLNEKKIISNPTELPVIIHRLYPPEYVTYVNNFKINKFNVCDIDHGATYDLIVFVTSAVGNFKQRKAIRETWGGFAVERGAIVLFLVGYSLNSTTVEKVLEEDEKYSDIIQGEYIDSYYNLTLKTMSMMKWVSDNCEKIKFVFKVDDDVFVNMQAIVDFSELRFFKLAIIGNIARKWAPHRNPVNKWYIPKSIYKEMRYPNFATGTSYLFTGDAARPLYETAIKMTPWYLEDVFMTGIVAEKAHIRRLHHSMIKNFHLSITPCNYRFFMTSHKHTPEDIKRLWKLIYEHPCDKKLQKAIDKKLKSISKNKANS